MNLQSSCLSPKHWDVYHMPSHIHVSVQTYIFIFIRYVAVSRIAGFYDNYLPF